MEKIQTLFNYEFKRFYKNPLQIFFVIVFPTLWMVISGKIWENSQIDNVAFINYMFAPIIIMVILVLTITNSPLNLGHNRQNKILKQYSILNIKKYHYLLASFLLNYLLLLIMFLILLLFGGVLFNLLIGIELLYIFLGASFIFISMFFLGVLVGSIFDTFAATLSLSLILLYFMLFTSGTTIPGYIAGEWFTYLQKVTIAGNGVLLLQQFFLGQNLVNDLFPLIYSIIFTIIIIPISIYFFKFN